WDARASRIAWRGHRLGFARAVDVSSLCRPLPACFMVFALHVSTRVDFMLLLPPFSVLAFAACSNHNRASSGSPPGGQHSPLLTVLSPLPQAALEADVVEGRGLVAVETPPLSVTVDDIAVPVDGNGNFTSQILLEEGPKTIQIGVRRDGGLIAEAAVPVQNQLPAAARADY